MRPNAAPGGSKMPSRYVNGKRPTENLGAGQDKDDQSLSGTSVFDPVLCELMYYWFSPEQGTILDPFAGGSVRGIVASRLKRKYFGIELRPEQVEANFEQGERICKDDKPVWITGDSSNMDNLLAKDFEADMVFTCPPYGDLEVYSDDPNDLSTMSYADFMANMAKIIALAAGKLKNNRFFVIVVGEYRDKKTGAYRGFVPDTIKACEAAGLKYYNEMILVTAVGSLPWRAGKIFTKSRKIGKSHQNVLVFCKGDPKLATKDLGDVKVMLDVTSDE